ncbi:PLCL2 [Bugula neritina]|uniref:PLCL2 n=1 Tax=Bugula neritina TaxID=10212 RepID=A0A7J7J0H0_BUGNE|nr:PLCL2 [Bugula neritina]
MFGIRADCANFRTKTVPGNGQNPFFDESFTFYTHFPEMALLKFTVLDDEFIGDEFIAQYTIPVDCINTGYRHINLLSSAGNKLAGCTLFVHITATHGADKAIDDTTKCLINNLSELAELKFNVETALIKFKEACDVGSVANIKYCVRTIANRACNAKGLTIKLVKSSGLPTFIISDGTPPDILKKALQAYLAWCKECKTLIDNGEPIRKTLLEIQALLRTIQSEMNSYVEEANLSEKKSQKALENFNWNMRVLKEQLTSLDQYTETCHSSFLKVIEAAQVNGVEVMTETES